MAQASKLARFLICVGAIILSVPLIAADQEPAVIFNLSGTDIALIITAFSALTSAWLAFWVQFRGQNEARKAREEDRIDRLMINGKVDAIKKATDGIVTIVGAASLAQGTAEGHAAGLQQGRAEGKHE